MTRAKDIVDSVQGVASDRHDTLYVPESEYNNVVAEVLLGGAYSITVDNVYVNGILVKPLPRIDNPILCKKGDVFPLTKDYRMETVE